MPRPRSSSRLPTRQALLAWLALGSTGFVPPPIHAASLVVSVRGARHASLEIALDWPEPLSPDLVGRLALGIPSTLAFEAELWRERRGWFDQSLATASRSIQITRDPWDGSYLARDGAWIVRGDSSRAVARSLTRPSLLLPLESDWVDSLDRYYVRATAIVRPLTDEDVLEIERWMGGGPDSPSRLVLGIPRNVLELARDLSGLGAQEETARSSSFRLIARPDTLLVVGASPVAVEPPDD